MSASIPSPDGVVDNDRHHHHDHHTVELDAAVTPAPTPDTDPVGVIEAALVRLVDDVGVLAEEDVVRAFSILKATDLPGYLRLRQAAKKANRDCSVTVLDKLVRGDPIAQFTWESIRHRCATLSGSRSQLVLPLLARPQECRDLFYQSPKAADASFL